MDEISGTENEIKQERRRYNGMVEEYNVFISRIPNSFFLGGRQVMPYFEAEEGSQTAPKVNLTI